MIGRGIKRPLSQPVQSCLAPRDELDSDLGGRKVLARSPHCCGCRRRRASTFRIAGVLGLHVLGFVACPCRGFAGSGARGGFLLERQNPGDIERGVDGGASVSGKCKGQISISGSRGRGGRRRVRQRGNTPQLNSLWFHSLSWTGTWDMCRVTRWHSADENRPSGVLYERGLFTSGVNLKNTFSRGNESGISAVAPPTAWGRTRVMASRAHDANCIESSPPAAEKIAEDLTSCLTSAVNRAISKVSSVDEEQQQWRQRQQQEERQAPPRPEEVETPPGRKWTGKNWTAASWKTRDSVRKQGRNSDTVKVKGAFESRDRATAVYATTFPLVGPEARVDVDIAMIVAGGKGRRRADGVNMTTWEGNFGESIISASLQESSGGFERRSWRVWLGPERVLTTTSIVQEEVGTTAREELTVYLLAMGASHHEAAAAGNALLAAGSRLSLTTMTWRRWKRNLDGLRRTGFTGADVANMLTLSPELLALDFEGQVNPTMEFLRKGLGMRPTDVRRVMRKAPEVLAPQADGSTAVDVVNVLRALGLQTRHLKMEALRWPQLLAVPPANFFQLAAFLASEEVGIKAANVGSLIRQAPWLVSERIDGQMLSVVRFLRRVGVFDMERIVRAYPKILAANVRSDLVPKVRFLWTDVGVSEEDLPRVLQTFPLLLAMPLARMRDVVDFLSVDLSINAMDLSKIVRAFPSLLGLERERHMAGVVHYLKKLGVQNVGRFVSRLPPVLGYDVETNLVPKMDFLVNVMGLSVYDVLTFPAYFSYPLETVIEPRTEFLNIRGRPITLVGLNIALQGGDGDFTKRVAKVKPEVYLDFKQAYIANREAVRNEGVRPESLLSESRRRAIGSLRGQTTSSNILETPADARWPSLEISPSPDEP